VHAVTMGVYTRNGIVFTAGTTDWAQVLEQDRNVAAITRNVVDRLLASRTSKGTSVTARNHDCGSNRP